MKMAKSIKSVSLAAITLVAAGAFAVSTPSVFANEFLHTVQAGEYLYVIAEKYGVSVAQLKEWNQLSDNLIYPNMQLRVQALENNEVNTETEITQKDEQSEVPIAVDASNYTVKKGDTLWAITKAHNVTVDQLRQWNNLTSDALQIGQKLVLQGSSVSQPKQEEAPPSMTYIVKAGDSLWKIATAHKVTVDQLRQWNNLTSDALQIGQKLVLQGSSASQPKQEEAPPFTTYKVKAGDNLWRIARNHQVSLNALREWNHLKSDLLSIGQTLIIKGAKEETSAKNTYTVKAGDNLWKIARQYKVTVNQLRQWNGLSSNLLHIGQTLIVGAQ